MVIFIGIIAKASDQNVGLILQASVHQLHEIADRTIENSTEIHQCQKRNEGEVMCLGER